jgi:hypothetical protein
MLKNGGGWRVMENVTRNEEEAKKEDTTRDFDARKFDFITKLSNAVHN